MSKVDELKKQLNDTLNLFAQNAIANNDVGCDLAYQLFDGIMRELIEAVRAEEYQKHLCSLDCARSYSCDKCPAKDTKYCRGFH